MEQIRRYFTKKNIAITAILLLFIVLLYLFLPIFHTKNIIILGNSDIKETEARELSAVNLEKNIYFVNTEKIESNYMQSPKIKSITVKRKFPRTLIYQITERKAIATLKFTGGFAIIDDSGVVLKTTSNINEIVKPLINGIQLSEIVVGRQITSKDIEKLTAGLDALSNVKSAQLLNNISQIDLSDPLNMHMITPQGIIVLLGEGKEMNEKMRVLNKILIDLFERSIYSGYIDMRFDAYPVYRSTK